MVSIEAPDKPVVVRLKPEWNRLNPEAQDQAIHNLLGQFFEVLGTGYEVEVQDHYGETIGFARYGEPDREKNRH